jgi:hypothetical protein
MADHNRLRARLAAVVREFLAEEGLLAPSGQGAPSRFDALEDAAVRSGRRPDVRAARAGASGRGRGRVPLPDLRGSGAAEAGAAAVDPDPPRAGVRDGDRVLLPALSPVFFSLSPRRWGWSRTMT